MTIQHKLLKTLKHLTIILIVLTNFRHLKFIFWCFKGKISINALKYLYAYLTRCIFIHGYLNKFNKFLLKNLYWRYANYLHQKVIFELKQSQMTEEELNNFLKR